MHLFCKKWKCSQILWNLKFSSLLACLFTLSLLYFSCRDLIFDSNLNIFFPLVCLRIQINPQNKGDFLSISPERAFADFLFAHTVLHLVVMNFIGWNVSDSLCLQLSGVYFTFNSHILVSLYTRKSSEGDVSVACIVCTSESFRGQ